MTAEIQTPAPHVSVIILTYNHETYIERAVESALAQQTTFPVEILVCDDCSTDGARRLLLALQANHPGRLQLQLREVNLGAGENLTRLLGDARGDYVAILEGDDYWTDSQKLQRQATALDGHPEWAVCFHRALIVDEGDRTIGRMPADDGFPSVSTFDDILRDNFIATSTVMFRNRLFGEFPAAFRGLVQQDWPLHLLNSQHGAIGYLHTVMGAYRIHSRGVWSRRTSSQRYAAVFDACDALEDFFGDELKPRIRAIRKQHLLNICQELDGVQKSASLRVGRTLLRPFAWLRRRLHRS